MDLTETLRTMARNTQDHGARAKREKMLEAADRLEELEGLLRKVTTTIDPVLEAFDGTTEHDRVLMPLCMVGMEINAALAASTASNEHSGVTLPPPGKLTKQIPPRG